MIKQIIREALGVHEDVKSLAEFLHNYFQGDTESQGELDRMLLNNKLSSKEYVAKSEIVSSGGHIPKGIKVFTSEELPTLKDLKIDKLIVEYKPRTKFTVNKAMAQFEVGKSSITDKGVVGYLKFIDVPETSVIYHELTHVLQFYKLGKKKMVGGLKSIKASNISASLIKRFMSQKEYEVLETFAYYIYQSNNEEITAKTTETYSTIKSFLKNKDVGRLEKNRFHYNDSNLSQNSITHFIKSTYGYQVSEMMMNYDIFSEFNNLDPDLVIRFFSYIKDYESFMSLHEGGWKRMWEIVSTIVKLMFQSKTQRVKLLSEDEVISVMKHYGDQINRQGSKLQRKIGKLYAHFV